MAFEKEQVIAQITDIIERYKKIVILQIDPVSGMEEKATATPASLPDNASAKNTALHIVGSTGTMLFSLGKSIYTGASYLKCRMQHTGEIEKLDEELHRIKTFSALEDSNDWIRHILWLGDHAHTCKFSLDYCELQHVIRHIILNAVRDHDDPTYFNQMVEDLQNELVRKRADLKTHIRHQDDQEAINLLEKEVHGILRQLCWLGHHPNELDFPSTIRKVFPAYQFPIKGLPHRGRYRYFQKEEAESRHLPPNQPFPAVLLAEFSSYFHQHRLKNLPLEKAPLGPPDYQYVLILPEEEKSDENEDRFVAEKPQPEVVAENRLSL